jgi:hypothetical protein
MENNLKLKSFTLLLTFIMVIAVYYASYGSWNLIREAYIGSAFDSLAQNLLELRVEVDPEAIGKEAFIVNGKSYMYFGPFPAFLRIIFNFINRDLHGQWTCFSKITAYILNLLILSQISLLALNLNTNIDPKFKSKLFIITIIGFAFATPLFYLIMHNAIYSESIIWALFFSTATLYFYLRYNFSNKHPGLSLLGIGTCAGLTLLSRISFAIPLFFILVFLLIKILIKETNKKSLFFILIPFSLALGFQFWYNVQRFGGITKVYETQYHSPNKQHPVMVRARALKLCDLRRVGETTANYFGPNYQMFTESFPWIKFYIPQVKNRTGFSYLGPIFPFSLSSLWLIILSSFGFYYLCIYNLKASHLMASSALLLQALLLLGFRAMDYRYSTEFLPLLIYLYFFSLLNLGQLKFQMKPSYIISTILILALSIYLTVFGALMRQAMFSGSANERKQAQELLIS